MTVYDLSQFEEWETIVCICKEQSVLPIPPIGIFIAITGGWFSNFKRRMPGESEMLRGTIRCPDPINKPHEITIDPPTQHAIRRIVLTETNLPPQGPFKTHLEVYLRMTVRRLEEILGLDRRAAKPKAQNHPDTEWLDLPDSERKRRLESVAV